MEENRMKLILLPGLDGTGVLFKPLLAHIPASIDVEVITLLAHIPASIDVEVITLLGNHDIKQQALNIAARLKDQKLIIFAESYSGRLAYELCLLQLDIKKVIFGASFLTKPSLISAFSSLLPLSLLRAEILPKRLLSWLLFNDSQRGDLVQLFYSAIANVDNASLRQRLKHITQLIPPQDKTSVSCCYIKASHDRLVSDKCITPFHDVFFALELVELSGGHFIAQCDAAGCWKIIEVVMSLSADNDMTR